MNYVSVFFFKQKTAYEMRISDWSSDVCSSDLLGVRQVDAVVTAQQTPLERVREIGAALGVQINGQQSAQLQRAVRALERPILPPGHSPGQERLAELFIKNTPEKHHADPRLSPAQAIADAAMKTAADRGESARMVATIRESTRQQIGRASCRARVCQYV